MSDTTLLEMTLHDVGEGLAEAEIVEWTANPGDKVVEDQTLLLISTDKATVELPAPASGILREQAVAVGDRVTVGTLLARIEVSLEAARKLQPDAGATETSSSTTTQSQSATREDGESAPSAPVAAAPSTRKLAQQLNVDLTRVKGSGPNGRILDDDVRKAAENTGASATQSHAGRGADEARVPLNRTRLATARSTAASWREIPHIIEFRQLDATALHEARISLRAQADREGIKLTFLPFFVKAAAIALQKNPTFNARLDMEREELVYRKGCHIGIATASDAGLTVPVLHHVETQSVLEIARSLESMIDRAKRQVLSLSDMAEGTFTITNFGSYGTWLGTPIIRAPEVAIAGFGRIQPGVLPIDGAAVVCPVLPLSVATDHRVNDGVHLAAFIDTLAEALTTPSLLSA
jgi:pyruvate dehydrogenase E2 component (dihydrolipoamide acetyltransferase)